MCCNYCIKSLLAGYGNLTVCFQFFTVRTETFVKLHQIFSPKTSKKKTMHLIILYISFYCIQKLPVTISKCYSMYRTKPFKYKTKWIKTLRIKNH